MDDHEYCSNATGKSRLRLHAQVQQVALLWQRLLEHILMFCNFAEHRCLIRTLEDASRTP